MSELPEGWAAWTWGKAYGAAGLAWIDWNDDRDVYMWVLNDKRGEGANGESPTLAAAIAAAEQAAKEAGW